NDLVDELDDAGFLVAFGDLVVFADEQLYRLVFGPRVHVFGADTVVVLESLFDLHARSQSKLDGSAGVKPDCIEHGGVGRGADGDLDRTIHDLGGEHGILESDFGGDPVAGFGGDLEFGELQVLPVQSGGEL